MPTYSFKCNKCNHSFRRFMPAAEVARLYDLGGGMHCQNSKCNAQRITYQKSDISVRDGFQPGPQMHLPRKKDGTPRVINTYGAYLKELKHLKLREAGNEDVDPYAEDLISDMPNVWDESTVKWAVQEGLIDPCDGQLIKHLLAGGLDELTEP